MSKEGVKGIHFFKMPWDEICLAISEILKVLICWSLHTSQTLFYKGIKEKLSYFFFNQYIFF